MEKTSRENLKAARRRAGLTQQQMADKLGIGLRNYKYIEAGKVIGSIYLWDALEMADSMQSMVFTPSILSSQDAALAKLQTVFDADNLNILLRHLDLNGYGNELIAADHEELTPYGLIRQQNGEPIPIRQKEDQEMGMEVCR